MRDGLALGHPGNLMRLASANNAYAFRSFRRQIICRQFVCRQILGMPRLDDKRLRRRLDKRSRTPGVREGVRRSPGVQAG
jgi:hypothetical protein